MLRDFVLELVAAPGAGALITLPGVAPAGRITWASAFVTSQQFVFYVLDNSIMQEWGVGQLGVGAPSTIIRPTVVLGNSAGTTARLNFTSTARCYSSLPALSILASTNNAIGRNILHNSRFEVSQRGVGPWTTVNSVLYGADRWFHNSAHAAGSFSDTLAAFSDANRTLVGSEAAVRALQSVVVGGATSTDFDLIGQNIEGVRTLAGKTVTLSFWALASSAGAKIGIEGAQIFGTGGSPSAAVTGISGAAVTLTTGYVRYSATLTFPSVAGKTFGSNGDDYTQILLWLSAGSTYSASRASAIGVQSATFTIWGLQLEFGSTPTALDVRPYEMEVALCQRFYETGSFLAGGYGVPASANVYAPVNFATTKRATPSLQITGTAGNANVASATAAAASVSTASFALAPTATGGMSITISYAASSDL